VVVYIVKHFQAILGQIGPLLGSKSGFNFQFKFYNYQKGTLRDFTCFELSRVKIHQQV